MEKGFLNGGGRRPSWPWKRRRKKSLFHSRSLFPREKGVGEEEDCTD